MLLVFIGRNYAAVGLFGELKMTMRVWGRWAFSITLAFHAVKPSSGRRFYVDRRASGVLDDIRVANPNTERER